MARTTKKATKTKARKSTSKKATPKKAKANSTLAALRKQYPHVTAIAAIGTKDNPTRVVIECQGHQGGGHAADCSATREIATQDAFQVQRSIECQREFARRRRRKDPAA